MSEEQTDFKVTDRRLFNADGTPREVERDESTTTRTPPTPDEREASSSGATASAAAAAASASQADTSGAGSHSAATASAARETRTQDEGFDEVGAEQDIPGANDPASFLNFLMSIASNAAAALGMMEHPVTGERGVDLQLAKHWIDVLGMLEQKTRGNLVAQEQQIFEGLLSDLRLQYVSLTGTTSPTQKRGFTGRDITGGK